MFQDHNILTVMELHIGWPWVGYHETTQPTCARRLPIVPSSIVILTVFKQIQISYSFILFSHILALIHQHCSPLLKASYYCGANRHNFTCPRDGLANSIRFCLDA